MHGLIQEMGGGPQDLRRAPTARRNGEEEVSRGAEQPGVGVGGGAPPPLGRRGMSEEKAQGIVEKIVNFLLGGGPPSGQAPATQRQQA